MREETIERVFRKTEKQSKDHARNKSIMPKIKKNESAQDITKNSQKVNNDNIRKPKEDRNDVALKNKADSISIIKHVVNDEEIAKKIDLENSESHNVNLDGGTF